MANIFLRLPRIQAQLIRHLDEDHYLTPTDPFKVSDYTEMAYNIRIGLVKSTYKMGGDPLCLSQQEWNNIMQGKKPQGGPVILKRDATVWPTYDEICKIIGSKSSQRSDDYDYLCIQLPREVFLRGKMWPVNTQWSLTRNTALYLNKEFARMFKYTLLRWSIDNEKYCIRKDSIIERSQVDVLVRFCERYDINVNTDQFDNLRRQVNRWLKDASEEKQDYRCLDIEYEDSNEKIHKFD